MPIAIQNRFDGGIAEDLATHSTNECAESLNFDIFTNPHKLIPYPDSVTEDVSESYTQSMLQVSDIDVSLVGTTYTLTGTGYASGSSSNPGFLTKADTVTDLAFYQQATGGAYIKGTLVIYKDIAYCLGYNSTTGYDLFKKTASGNSVNVGTITTPEQSFVPRPFVHPSDDLLYIVIGNTIARFNGTDNIGSGGSVVTNQVLNDTAYQATSITNSGDYLAIAMRPKKGTGSSYCYLWGRDTSLTTIQGIIDFGEGGIYILENLNNNLIALTQPANSLFLTSAIDKKFDIKAYSGGAVETLKSITIDSTQGIGILKSKNNQKLYFASIESSAVFVVGKNKLGNYVVTQDRYFKNGTECDTVSGLSLIGDTMWALVVIDSVYYLQRSMINGLGETPTYASTSIYKTTINPAMPLIDRAKNKQLDAIQIAYNHIAGGSLRVKYSVNGSAMVQIMLESSQESGSVFATCEYDGSAFLAGKDLQFQVESTGGLEIKEIKYKYTNLNELL